MLSAAKKKIKKKFYSLIDSHIMTQVQKQLAVHLLYSADEANKKSQNKKVVYTCLTGNYDNLPLHQYLEPTYDYVCFTDNPSLLSHKCYGEWEIRPLAFSELSNQLNNRYHKTHPHILFPEYEESIYLDANISIKSDLLFREIEEKGGSLVIPIHYKNDCIYQEAVDVEKAQRDSTANIKNMLSILKADGFPAHYGLNENNVIYRKHHDKKIIEIMEQWWHFIKDVTKRDQLSLSYVLWKNGIAIDDIAIPNVRIDRENFLFFSHTK